MVVHEFRIPLPLSVEEFGRGQLYMTAHASLENSQGDEGIEWIKNEPYDNTDGHLGTSEITGTLVPRNKGQYTLKRYHFKSKVPGIVTHLAPSNALFLIEEAWNSYPHCKTVLVNGYLSKSTLRIDVETMHVDGEIDRANAVGLSPEELKARKVEYLDIRAVSSDATHKDYKVATDASKYHSAKTGRGPLGPGWERSGTKPLMCCYKVVRADFKVFGLQTTGEGIILNQQRGIFSTTLNKAFVTLDEWIELDMVEIRKLEAEVARRANEQLQKTVKAAAALPASATKPTAHGHGTAGGAGSAAAATH